jgi:LmbE family N-acetylglucosaminyl deacetylase
MTVIDVQRGTDEQLWRDWPAMTGWPQWDPASFAQRPIVVLAAHPDDEVLALGGTLALLARLGAALTLVWASDGEASHPGSTAAAVPHLGRLRRRETRAALARLGVGGDACWLGLPDGRLTERYDVLVRAVTMLHRPGAVWFAPFRHDGHPDHEACGHAAAEVVGGSGELVEFPIWAWHWAAPGDGRVPWDRARAVRLPEHARAAKRAAIDEFHTQVRPLGPNPADRPVLPPAVLAHFDRDVEVVLA